MRKEMSIWDRGFECEVPRSVGNRVFAGVSEMLKFMTDAGAKTITYDNDFDCWRCSDPEWIADREKYSDMVQRNCERWGSCE